MSFDFSNATEVKCDRCERPLGMFVYEGDMDSFCFGICSECYAKEYSKK